MYLIPAVFFGSSLPATLEAHPEVAADCVCVIAVHIGDVARTIELLEPPGSVRVEPWPGGADFVVAFPNLATWEAVVAAPETMATLVDAGTIDTGDAPYGAQVLGRLITLVREDAL